MRRLSLWIQAHPMVGDGILVPLIVLSELPMLGQLLDGRWPVNPALYTLSSILLLAPLVIRRSRPVLSAYLVLLGGLLQLIPQGEPGMFDPSVLRMADVSLGISLYTLLVYVGRRQALRYAVALAVAVGGWASTRLVDSGGPVAILFFAVMFFALCWVLGEFIGARRAYQSEQEQRLRMLETERDQHARIAVAEERARIARELHDVVAHSVSVMVVQADGAGYALRTQPELAEDAVRTISKTGRDALTELRKLLDVLRSDEPSSDGERVPQPGADSLAELVAKVRATGMPVELELSGPLNSLPTGVGLAIYRIAQEALTNTLKHAGTGASARVRVRGTEAGVDVEITDDGQGTPARLVDTGGGNGLIGMRERATVFGGTLRAGPRTGGGWRVHANIPLGEA